VRHWSEDPTITWCDDVCTIILVTRIAEEITMPSQEYKEWLKTITAGSEIAYGGIRKVTRTTKKTAWFKVNDHHEDSFSLETGRIKGTGNKWSMPSFVRPVTEELRNNIEVRLLLKKLMQRIEQKYRWNKSTLLAINDILDKEDKHND